MRVCSGPLNQSELVDHQEAGATLKGTYDFVKEDASTTLDGTA
jgi:hypothetical protein